MQHLYDFDEKDYGTLLAADVLDASKGAMFAAKGLKPNSVDRTILIGLGGTGVRTVDYVKGAISKRLNATWKNYIAFLAIDASWTELQNAAYLEPKEWVQITRTGVESRMSNEATHPAAVRRFMPKNVQLQNLHSDGAGRTRLVGKVKIHDQAPGSLGVDEEIVQKLVGIKADLTPLVAPGKYQIYVIGSVCGGTCSGGVLEMPALIRQAIPQDLQINAMLYLPDTLASLDPANASHLYANGYATLKELDYFMGMRLRQGYTETWSYNSLAMPELTAPASTGFIDLPYLIGTVNGVAPGASKEAMTVIAEYLISMLAEVSVPQGEQFLPSAFLSNALMLERERSFAPSTQNQQAAHGSYHEYPRRYAAIGFAEASAPQKLVRAYTVGKVCAKAGLKPIDANERAKLLAAGGGVIIPFRGRTDLLNAVEGTNQAMDLLKPIANVQNIIHSGTFSLRTDLNQQEITWTRIHNGSLDAPGVKNATDNYVESKVGPAMADNLRGIIRGAYAQYRQNVQAYVREEGPYAFVNLYNGNFAPVNGDYGVGIGAMLRNLTAGKELDGRNFSGWVDVNKAKENLDAARGAIDGLSTALFNFESRQKRDQAVMWTDAYDRWVKARIDQKRRDIALGNHGALRENFQIPAAQLTREIQAFGCVLDSLAGIYQQQGATLSDFDDFQKAQDNKTEVNIAAVTPYSYLWLKNQADQAVLAVNAKNLRNHIVDNFFDTDANGISNIEKWLEVPDNRVQVVDGGKVQLKNPDVSVPAREVFDGLLINQFPMVLNVSIETMFQQLADNGSTYDQTANAIMRQLANRSRLQLSLNGSVPDQAYFISVMYPSALLKSAQNGPAIAKALEQAAKTVFNGLSVHSYASDDADTIMCYQLAAPFEIYRLADIGKWEQDYENGAYGILSPSAHLHGLSPAVDIIHRQGMPDEYVERMAWKDYPSIAPVPGDPRNPNPATGIVSREGQLRKNLDERIAAAKKLGVLYSEQQNSGWVIQMVYCDRTIEWAFDVMQCQPDPNTGLLPLGKELAQAVASQNSRALEQLTQTVRLDCDGVVGKPLVTEALAWENAARVLRFHVPMYERMCSTLEKFQVWAKVIQKYNEEMLRRLMPAQMYLMLRGQILRHTEDGAWKLTMPNGLEKLVANLTPAMSKFLPPKDKKLIDNGLLGYYLFGKLCAALNNSSDAFTELSETAKEIWDGWINTGDTVNLEAGEACAKLLDTEREKLQQLGAHLDGDPNEKPTGKFQKAVADIESNLNPVELDLFYYRAGLWQYL